MRIKYFIIAVISGLFFLSSQSFAALDLELTQGVDRAIPIAILPFDNASVKLPEDMAKIISEDLSHTGQFKTAESADFPSFLHRGAGFDLQYWKEKKFNDVVIGTVKFVGGKYQIEINLIDIYSTSNKPILTQVFTASENELRKTAHRIADVIYEKILGIRGVFSTKIAYVLSQRIGDRKFRYSLMIADMDGYQPRSILVSSEPIMSPTWSKDGRRIAYVSFENRRASIYISEVSTGSRKLVSQMPGINGAPAWSPDGKKLAVALSQGESPKIFMIDLGTLAKKQLTSGFAIDTEPSFSPDGKYLLFTSDRGGRPQIYQLELASNRIDRVTYQGDYNARASFTPDGQSIVLLHQDGSGYSIATQDLRASTLTVLSDGGHDQSPSVAPNGQMVIYAARDRDKGVLGLVSIDGRVKLRYPESDGEVREPAWAPFAH